MKTLKDNNVVSTFFIDGLFIDNNNKIIKNLKDNNHEVELLSYNDGYNKNYFINGLHNLFSITNIEPKFCYADYDNKEVLELCNSLNLHTIIPSINIDNNSFGLLKDRLDSGLIIRLNNNNNDLNTIINYIKQRGYKLVTLEELLIESFEK